MSSRSDIAISVRGLGKAYTIAHNQSQHTTAAEALMSRLRRPLQRARTETFWALKDVSFDVQRGDVVGIIGRNGAGKSTLLKILSRITEPTTGEIDLYGRVGSLLEVGTGFHPELTGRENIYLNGAILGMRKSEIDRQFDAIVDFAGVEQFLDTPVKRYSSGMYVRLAFAVAAHLRSEILVVDEVLAVGDAEFQKKCLGKMKDVASGGRTVLFVSHNMAAVEALCPTSVHVHQGSIVDSGSSRRVLAQYCSPRQALQGEVDLTNHPGRCGSSEPTIIRARLVDSSGVSTTHLPVGKPFSVEIQVAPREPVRDPAIGIGCDTAQGQRVFTVHTRQTAAVLGPIQGKAWVRCTIPVLRLMPGRYVLKLAFGTVGVDIDTVEDALRFDAIPSDAFGSGYLPNQQQGLVLQEAEWELVRREAIAC